ncbi:hypothetical protein BU23DRAFT_546683 [Bimuria novae-zelandiae CBS 107.79]|uniref:BTB domain-containing protein n=1 Tax=Bimuria novae-zelandiae CBS 107.79 TaxID=1447943 RepID=A0A6A5UKR5_9PLEO|nr:hypothetical protein BU23DRAFT_546683 [Bimuria novae-zelandiae CBS 107.79]
MAPSTITKPSPSVADIFSSPTAVIKIGEEGKEYIIHKALLAHYSEYFRAALEPSTFQKGITNTITLSDVDSGLFEPFIEWIYTQKVPDTKLCDYHPPKREKLARLYVLADRLLVPKLKEVIFNISLDHYQGRRCTPSYKTVSLAFNSLPDQDPYLQLLVDAQCRMWKGDDDASEAKLLE